LRLFSFGDYGLALAALALVVFSAYDSYPKGETRKVESVTLKICILCAPSRFFARHVQIDVTPRRIRVNQNIGVNLKFIENSGINKRRNIPIYVSINSKLSYSMVSGISP